MLSRGRYLIVLVQDCFLLVLEMQFRSSDIWWGILHSFIQMKMKMATTTVPPKSDKMDKLHVLQLLHVCQEIWSAKLWLREGLKNFD